MDGRFKRLGVVTAIVAGTGIVLSMIPEATFNNGRFDSVLDGALAIAMFMVALVFFLSQRLAGSTRYGVCWAFLACGVIRFYGSAVDSENGIVWLHRLCSLLLVVVVLDSECLGASERTPRRWTKFIYLGLVLIATLVAIHPGSLPPAVNQRHALAPAATLLCLLTALTYGVAAWRSYVTESRRSWRLDRTVWCCLALGIPPLYYVSYPVWSAQWWCFQFFELGATGYLALSLMHSYLGEVVRLRTELIEKTRHMERTLALVSHDVRNPLGVIATGVEFLRDLPGRAPEVVLDKMRSNVEYINEMIQTLIESTSSISGLRTELEFSDGDLNEIVRTALDAHPDEELARVRIEAPPEPVRGKWPRTALRRVISNLVSNAFKYGAKEGDVTVTVRRSGDLVRLSVHNEGPPIAENDRRRIFQPYHRAPSTARGSVPGWGLGLSLVQNVADEAGGRVWVESESSRGTTFNFEIPAPHRSPG